jgi:hypothetical protein
MRQAWHRLPGWSKGLLAQALAWAAANSIVVLSTIQSRAIPDSSWLILIQGLLAALICHLFGLQRWWLIISLLFSPAISLAQAFMLPSWVYLWAFILSLTFFWSVIYRGAPLYLSGPKTWATVTDLLPRDHSFRFIDLGSGLGGLILNLSRQYPNGEFHGVEFAPGPWLVSKLRNWLAGGRVNFFRQDYRKLDLGSYDVVFVFLSPLVMQEIADKARAEMRSGSLLLSLAFPLPGIKPHFTLNTNGNEGHLLYGWRA